MQGATNRISEQCDSPLHIRLKWRIHDVDYPFAGLLSTAQKCSDLVPPALILFHEGFSVDRHNSRRVGRDVFLSYGLVMVGDERDNVDLPKDVSGE